MSFRAQRVRDPLHNVIEFPPNQFEDAMWRVIQTRPFQRLRRIKQLGFSELVYPGATHTRFAHSVGVYHTARTLHDRIRSLQTDRTYLQTEAQTALAAALVHDVGHGPFSHAFEDIGKRLGLKMARHEDVSDALIRNGDIADVLNTLHSGFSTDVANLVGSKGPRNIYAAIVSSQFDADRLDYMRRDRLMCGTQHGAIDFDWLLSNLEIGNVRTGVDTEEAGEVETFVLGPKAIYAAETYLVGLFQLYPTVYFHKATRCAEKLFSELLSRLFDLVIDGSTNCTGLARNHPLVEFARNHSSIEAALKLDDFVVWGALEMMTNAKDVRIRGVATRLRDRKLLRSIELFNDETLAQAWRISEPKLFLDSVELFVRSDMKKRASQIGPDGVPRILFDRVNRSIYKELDNTKGPLNQILIRDRTGRLQDVKSASRVVGAIREFDGLRAHIKKDDSGVEPVIRESVQRGIQYAQSKKYKA